MSENENKPKGNFYGAAANRIYLDKYTATIERADVFLVNVKLKDGKVLEKLEPRRLFPMSDPENYITLLDNMEHEIAFVRRLDELDKESADVLRACFKEFYFVPEIKAILNVTDVYGVVNWTVMTDRGEITFRINNVRNDIKFNPKTGVVRVRDSNDNRFVITNFYQLDKKSQKWIGSYL